MLPEPRALLVDHKPTVQGNRAVLGRYTSGSALAFWTGGTAEECQIVNDVVYYGDSGQRDGALQCFSMCDLKLRSV